MPKPLNDDQLRTVVLMFNLLFGSIFLSAMAVMIWVYWGDPVMRPRLLLVLVGVAILDALVVFLVLRDRKRGSQ